MVRPKDLVPLESISDRSLSSRMKEHQWAEQIGDTDFSTVSDHAWKEGHHVDWDGACVLDT